MKNKSKVRQTTFVRCIATVRSFMYRSPKPTPPLFRPQPIQINYVQLREKPQNDTLVKESVLESVVGLCKNRSYYSKLIFTHQMVIVRSVFQ